MTVDDAVVDPLPAITRNLPSGRWNAIAPGPVPRYLLNPPRPCNVEVATAVTVFVGPALKKPCYQPSMRTLSLTVC